MKILKVTGGFIPAEKQGGTAVVGHALSKYLAKEGHEVKVFTTNINGNEFLDIKDEWKYMDGMEVYYAKATKKFLPYYSPSMINEFKKHIQNADVVLLAGVWTWYAPKIAKICRANNVPYILYPHGVRSVDRMKMQGYLKKLLWWHLFDKNLFFKADGLVAITEFEKEEMRSIGVTCPIEVIPNGVEAIPKVENPRKLIYNKYGIAEDSPIIFFIGRIELIKGVDLAIKSMKYILKKVPNATLVLAGPDRDNLTNKLYELAKELNISSRVVFTGSIKGDIKFALYQSARVLILLSITEVLAMAVLEGLRSGVPIVFTDKNAFVDIVDNQAGIACRRDEVTIANAIIDIILDDVKYNKLSKNAIKLATDKFTWEIVALKSIDFINRIIRNKYK